MQIMEAEVVAMEVALDVIEEAAEAEEEGARMSSEHISMRKQLKLYLARMGEQ